jgi:hypothetical protein
MMAVYDLPAVLTRDMGIRVIDVSGSGCLLESRRRLVVGTIGRLRMTLGAEECEDDVEVVRCDAVQGTRALFHIGVRLLWTTPRREGTIRIAISRHAGTSDPVTPGVM